MEKLILHNINKSYERGVPVLKDISLSVAKGDFVVLLGPSGSGKSTILSIIAGLEQQTSGDVIIDGINCNQVPCQKREIAMVFQNYALYPSMNVYNNIAFPLVNKHEKRTVINQKVSEISKALHIEDILRKKVNKISGGQKQRVAIGRALIRNPALLLLDEPLSNLDAVLRTQMRKELYNLHSQLKTTMVYVTHDQAEALSLATKIVVLNNGEIQQIGTPREIYDFPKNVFVATFIGTPQMNIFKECNASLLNGSNFSVSLLENTFYINPINLIDLPVSVDIGIRSEDMELIENDGGKVHIVQKEFFGDMYIYHCKLKSQEEILFCVKTKEDYSTENAYDVKATKIHVFDAFTKERLSIEII